jgi:hypothetical protein
MKVDEGRWYRRAGPWSVESLYLSPCLELGLGLMYVVNHFFLGIQNTSFDIDYLTNYDCLARIT